jgi:hypothetical protein
MRKLKFTKSHAGYNPGEVAGFEDDAAAAKMVALGVAEDAEPASPAESTTTEEEAPAETPRRRRGGAAAEE